MNPDTTKALALLDEQRDRFRLAMSKSSLDDVSKFDLGADYAEAECQIKELLKGLSPQGGEPATLSGKKACAKFQPIIDYMDNPDLHNSYHSTTHSSMRQEVVSLRDLVVKTLDRTAEKNQ